MSMCINASGQADLPAKNVEKVPDLRVGWLRVVLGATT